MGRKGSKGPGLKTSREIFDRIRWDPNLDARVFVVGYEERFTGLRERSVEELSEDVPWHRVQHFRVGDLVVWSRPERIDRLFGSGRSEAEPERIREAIASALAERQGGAVEGLEAVSVYRFDPGRDEWVAESDAPQARPLASADALTVVSLNVLFDLHDPEPLHTPRRVVGLLERLRREKADVIALQEVTPGLVESLLDAPWVREGYWISDGPAADTVRPYGQLVLSRWPMQARLRRADGGGPKRFLYVDLAVGGQRVAMAVVHLTSDRAKRAQKRRDEQLAQIVRDLAATDGPALLVGDFNSDDPAIDEPLEVAGWSDVWPMLRPHEDGPTFDPQSNGLAAITSRNPRPRRLDRIWVRGTARLRPVDVVRVATEPEVAIPKGDRLPVSDHYGLRARLALLVPDPVELRRVDAAPVHRTAVVVIPPRSKWAPIQAIRQAHDRAARRWMPHVTLLYGFVPPEQLDEAADAVERALAEYGCCSVTLERVKSFEHRRGATVWLEPRVEPAGALHRIQAAMEAVVPRCNEQSRHGSGFTPHLTLGQSSRGALAQTVASWQAAWEPQSFMVHAVVVIVRRGDEPFEVHRVIPLRGSVGCREPEPALCDEVARLLGSLEGVWSHCMRTPATTWPLQVVGSHRLGVAAPDADLDVIGLAPAELSLETLSERLVAGLRDHGHTVVARPVTDATVPRVALTIDGRDVDLQPVRWSGPDVPPSSFAALLGEDGPRSFDPASHQALLAALDAEAVLRHVARHGGIDRFVRALAFVRGWAARRDLDANWLGYPGGLAWAVMVAWTASVVPADPTDLDPGRTLGEACLTLMARRTTRDWAESPLTLARPWWEAVGEHRGPMVIEAPALPARDCMVRATATTVGVVEEELDGAESDAVEPASRHAWFVVVTAHAADERDGARALGVLRKRAAGLVRGLERELGGGRLRPYSQWWAQQESGSDPDPGWSRVLLIGVESALTDEPGLAVAWRESWEREIMADEGWPPNAAVGLSVVVASALHLRSGEES